MVRRVAKNTIRSSIANPYGNKMDRSMEGSNDSATPYVVEIVHTSKTIYHN